MNIYGFRFPWLLVTFLLLIAAGLALADQGSREVFPASSMSGTIVGTFERGKLLLASNDKITVTLIKAQETKPGDYLEIYQPLFPDIKDEENPLYKKVGLAIVLEKMDDKNVVCIIDSSMKEISLGDLVRFGASR